MPALTQPPRPAGRGEHLAREPARRAARPEGRRAGPGRPLAPPSALKELQEELAIKGREEGGVPAPRSNLPTGVSDFEATGVPEALVPRPLAAEKTIVIVRHGQTTWNLEKRIQGESDQSVLTPLGREQAQLCSRALSRMPFDSCFASPISRARQFAEIMWAGREAPIHFLPSLKEAGLGKLQGLTNEEAARTHGELYDMWRNSPADFSLEGVYPVAAVFRAAHGAWREILEAPGQSHLVVTHKSILRALLCAALRLHPTSFRAFDVHNSGLVMFRVNRRGEPMLVHSNLTAHLHAKDVFY